MTSLAKTFRADLAERYVVRRPAITRDMKSTDGTRKWLLRFADGQVAGVVANASRRAPSEIVW